MHATWPRLADVVDKVTVALDEDVLEEGVAQLLELLRGGVVQGGRAGDE